MPEITQCPRCDYQLEGLPQVGTCPECGLDYDPLCTVTELGTNRWDVRQLVLAGILIAVALSSGRWWEDWLFPAAFF